MAEGKGGKSLKGQQALEYLTTYAWVIVIISLVLAVFLFLGVFSGGASSGNYCIPTPGYSCAQPLFNLTGNISVSLTTDVQASGPTAIYITGVSCSANTTTAPATFYPISIHKVTPGAYTTVDFRCPTLQHPNHVGSTFTGALWISYQTATQSNLQQAVAIVKATASTSVPSVNYCLPGTINTITVGNGAAIVLFSPDGKRAYVLNYLSGSISVINTTTFSVVNTINIGTQYEADEAAITPDSKYLYVGGYSNTVFVVNTVTDSIQSALPLPSWVTGSLSVNAINVSSNDYAYIAEYEGNGPYAENIIIINGLANTVVNTIPIFYSTYDFSSTRTSVSPNSQYVYVPNSNGNNVIVISSSTDQAINSIYDSSSPWTTFFSPSGSTAYIANENPGSISVVNTATYAVANTITLPNDGTIGSYDITPSSDGKYIYAIYPAPGLTYDIFVTINTNTYQITNTITFPTGQFESGLLALPHGEDFLYTVTPNMETNSIAYILNGSTYSVLNKIPVGLSTTSFISKSGAYIYASGQTLTGNGVITIINTTNNDFILNVSTNLPGGTFPAFSTHGYYGYVVSPSSPSHVLLLQTC